MLRVACVRAFASSHDEKPTYLIWGGLVFTRLTIFYLRSMYGTVSERAHMLQQQSVIVCGKCECARAVARWR